MVAGVQPDAAAVELDDLLADGQADPRTGVGVTSVEPLKDNEYLVCEARLDADPVVFDGDDPVAVPVTGAQTHDGRGIGVEFDGVADEVLEQRNEKGPIPVPV